MSILILGASGQLGHCIKKVVVEKHLPGFIFPEESVGDITDSNGLMKLFVEHNPAYVINCAAYTAVDKAEDDIDLCRKVNCEGPMKIAVLCNQFNSTMIHVSTDFVFEGSRSELLKETDVAEPINVYGLTKFEGEQKIAHVLNAFFILRTSWLYSEFGNNFVKTMLKLAHSRDELNVVSDQIGTPTYAIDLAGAILDIIASKSKAYGIYHYSNEGVTSWYDFAVGVFQLSGKNVNVHPILTTEYPTRAIRPKFSVMNKTKIKSTFGLKIPYWRDSLAICINRLHEQ